MSDKSATAIAPMPARPGFRLPFGRRGLLLAGLAAAGGGLALNWGWLTAIGAAPIILALAPCAVMCALGMCMMGGDKRSCATGSTDSTGSDKPETEPRATIQPERQR